MVTFISSKIELCEALFEGKKVQKMIRYLSEQATEIDR